MKIQALLPMAILLSPGALLAQTPQILPKSPAEAIALADRGSGEGVKGRFEMAVASTGKSRRATFLNSSPDYRSPGNLTFSLSPYAASTLAKRFAEAPQNYLLRKRIVVDGIIHKTVIYNSFAGQPRTFNRFGYSVEIHRVEQIVSID